MRKELNNRKFNDEDVEEDLDFGSDVFKMPGFSSELMDEDDRQHMRL